MASFGVALYNTDGGIDIYNRSGWKAQRTAVAIEKTAKANGYNWLASAEESDSVWFVRIEDAKMDDRDELIDNALVIIATALAERVT